MSGFEHIKLVRHQGVLQIGFNRPEKRNAFTAAMYNGIRQAIEAADKDPEIKAILFYGTAESFSSGNDLDEFNQRNPDEPSAGSQMLLSLHQLSKPLVAAVSGMAVGIGATMLLHCDLVFAARDTRFRLPFVNLGLCPEAGSSLLLPEVAGHRLAAEVLLLGDFFTPEKAQSLGMVNQVLPADQLMDHALQICAQLASKPVQALIETKGLLKQSTQQPVTERMKQEFQLFRKMLMSDESKAIRNKLKK